MAMNYRLLAAVLLLASLGGCARHEPRQGWVVDNHPYPLPGDAKMKYEEELPTEPPEEKPIVKIISGTEVSGPEEAWQLAVGGMHREHLGLRTPVEQLAINEVPLIQVASTLSEMTGYNITVTRAAAEEPVSVYLQNIPLRQALESICRLNDLWYREDERIVTLMTTEEYTREMVIRRNEKSRAYWLRYTNANDMAKVLQATMSSKIIFNDIGEEEVYGHVEEEKESSDSELELDAKDRGLYLDEDDQGNTVLRLDSRKNRGRLGSGNANSVQGFNIDELRRLIQKGELRQDSLASAEQLGRKIEKEVPAVLTVFKRNNVILARSLDETILQDIGRIIELMDTPTSQVLLEVSILQLNLGDGFESFFDLNFSGTQQYSYPDKMRNQDSSLASPSTRVVPFAEEAQWQTLGGASGIAESTLNVLFGNRNIQARLALFAKDDRLQVVSSPYLMSANNAKVKFFVGQEVPLRDDVTSNTLYNKDGNVTTSYYTVDIKREELGTSLEISSFINEDGTITMDLETEISSPQYNVTSILVPGSSGKSSSFPLDGTESSEITSIVTAASGQTIALGGIIREELSEAEKKVPLLGDIPGLGFFFKEVKDKRQKMETVILLTPHIISHPSLVGRVSNDFLRRRSSHPRFVNDQRNILNYPIREKEGQRERRAEPVQEAAAKVQPAAAPKATEDAAKAAMDGSGQRPPLQLESVGKSDGQ